MPIIYPVVVNQLCQFSHKEPLCSQGFSSFLCFSSFLSLCVQHACLVALPHAHAVAERIFVDERA